MPISDFPPVMQSTDSAEDYADKGDVWTKFLSTDFTTEANALEENVNAKETTSTENAAIATTQAELATTNGAIQVSLAADQASLATTNGAIQVSLATDQANIATSQADIAATVSKFKGQWSELVGVMDIPASVYHTEKNWQLIQSLTDVTTIEPGTNSLYWVEISSLPDQVNEGGNFLKTDGSTASWDEVLPEQINQSGKFLTTNGTDPSWDDVHMFLTGRQYFTTSGTFTVSVGITTIFVRIWGGGGGGAGGNNTHSGIGGGGGGYSERTILVTPGDTISVTIGSGGTGGALGVLGVGGGTTTFGSYMTASGGSGGPGPYSGTSSGGSSSGGDINKKGMRGLLAYDNFTSFGGSSPNGGQASLSNRSASMSGNTPGGGGVGLLTSGSPGADGAVEVKW